MATSSKDLKSFELAPGTVLGKKFRVLERLGSGWEGEVYRVRERASGVDRAAKIFYPRRDAKGLLSRRYARKLHKLRNCPLVIQYVTRETVEIQGHSVVVLISELVDGELLGSYVKRQPRRRLTPFQGMHLLHTLASGMEPVHLLNEYHGDLHADNVFVTRVGLGFELKVFDFYHWDDTRSANRREDLIDMIKIFYEALGGRAHYASQPPEVKDICRGLRRALILKRFPTASHLRTHLETFSWS